MKNRLITLGILFLCSTVSMAQETSAYWTEFGKSYVRDLREGGNGFTTSTTVAGQQVIELSKSALETRMVEYVLAEGKKSEDAGAYITTIHPKKYSDSLMLILAMNASYGQDGFLGYWERFNELYQTKIIPHWYIEDLVESVPNGKWLITSGQLETYQVKAHLLMVGKDVRVLDISVLGEFDYSKGLTDYALHNSGGEGLKEWLVSSGSQQSYISLLVKMDYYSELQSQLYVQGLTLLYSVSPWTDQQVNHRLFKRVKERITNQSPFLRNYIPLLESLQKTGVKTATYIRQIEQ